MDVRTALRLSVRVLLGVLLLVILLVAGWGLTHRDEARGLRTALVVASELEDVPGSAVARWGTDAPRATVVRQVGDLPATLTQPADGSSHPAVALLVPNGTTAEEARDAANLQRGLARAGLAAWAVRTPNPGSGLASDDSQQRLEAALLAIANDPTSRDSKLSLVATGSLGSQALVAAGTPELRSAIRGVVAVQPVADLRGVLQLAVTGITVGANGIERQHPAASDVRTVAGRSVVEVLQAHAEANESRLLDAVLEEAARSDDPIATLRGVPASALTPTLRQVRAVLDATDTAGFAAAWDVLPADLRADAESASPTSVAREIDARVLLLVPVDDSAWPSEDASRLQERLPNVRLVESDVLDPGASVEQLELGDVRSLAAALGWWLAEAGG
ncbi:MAG: hypothetical protein JWM90_524 [Thermoleophilia bacterium]|nr:hypothetical protein [Thermoleophilia bacterium]